jgi:hypothetical protein
MQFVLGDKLGLAVDVAMQIYLMFNQELELEAEDNRARIRGLLRMWRHLRGSWNGLKSSVELRAASI